MCAQILVVDDSPSWLPNLCTLLERAHFAVTGASSGALGLSILGSRALDGVVLDWDLFDIDAIPEARRLREREPTIGKLALAAVIHDKHPTVPIVLITAFGTDQLVDRAYRTGTIAGYVSKKSEDVRFDLLTAIEEAVGRAELRRNGGYWHVRFRSRTADLKHFIGFQYIQDLLIQEGKQILVSDLVRKGVGEDRELGLDGGEDAGMHTWLDWKCLERDRVSVHNAMERAYTTLRPSPVAPLEAYLRAHVTYHEFHYAFVPDVCTPLKWRF